MRDTANELVRPALGMDAGLRRAFDVVCAGMAALVLAPVMVILTLALLFEDGTPILFSQLRLGQHGRPFRMYKFRKFRPDCDNHGCPLTVEGDGRLTAVGRILAASKLDELPQLWNVLRGDMSIVGPRPESLAFTDCFRNGLSSRLSAASPARKRPSEHLGKVKNREHPTMKR